MKVIVISFAAFFAFVGAVPQRDEIQFSDARLVTDAISSAIQDLSQNIKDAGLDPFYIEEEDYSYALPVPVIFNAQAHVKNLLSTGLSNIVINRNNFGVLTQRLTLNVALPRIDFTLDNASGEVEIFANKFGAEASGTVSINQVQVDVNVRVSVGLISGISIRSLSMDMVLGDISSNLNLVVQGHDLSATLNNFLGITIPTTLNNFRSEINELLEIIVLEYINELL